VSAWSVYVAWAIGAALAVPALVLMLHYHRRGQNLSALCVTACYGLLLAPISWRPTWVWVVPAMVALLSWLQLTWRRTAWRGRSIWQRWAGASAAIAIVAVFTSTPVSRTTQQRPRTLSPVWFFILSNPYVLTTTAIALVLGTCWLRRTRISPIDEPADDAAVGAAQVNADGVMVSAGVNARFLGALVPDVDRRAGDRE